MTDLGISHLSRRQSHIQGGSVQRCGRVTGKETVPIGRVTAGDGIVLPAFPHAPPVKNTQHDGPGISAGIIRIRVFLNYRVGHQSYVAKEPPRYNSRFFGQLNRAIIGWFLARPTATPNKKPLVCCQGFYPVIKI